MADKVYLSVVIPAYNEESNIASTLGEVSRYLKERGLASEVIVIDDGSGDNTIEKARARTGIFDDLRVIDSKPNRGKGYVVRQGILATKGRYCMFMDADNATSIYELDKFLPYLEEGYDAVIGSRRMKNSEIALASPLRRFLGKIYILLSWMIIGVKVSDFNCGFKAYNGGSARKVFTLQLIDDWSFDSELIFLIKKMGMTIKEVPVRWAHKDTSKVRILKAGWESFLSLIKIRINDLRGAYKRAVVNK